MFVQKGGGPTISQPCRSATPPNSCWFIGSTGRSAISSNSFPAGTKIRAGLVEFGLKQAPDLSAAHVVASDLWRHADDQSTKDEAVGQLSDMLKRFIQRAEKHGLALAPFIGIGCPGLIRDDGSIERGGQNLPGNWEAEDFNPPQRILRSIPSIGGRDTIVVMHNDAVAQGLSEAPFMDNVARWGALTIGTGLGNAHFSRRPATDAGRR